ncbi:MAG: recombination protein NinB [Caulobacter sp.]|nr:recombination protein NinB [Caulobacter sp.]
MSRHVLKLSPSNRDLAFRGLRAAPNGWLLELKEPTRSAEQNAALWSLLTQIHKQRKVHNGVKMTPDLWKAVFMQAWGAEVVFLPTLEGDGMFPAGHRSSHLTVGEMTDLIEFILAWCATAGLTIEHFDAKEAA